MSFRAHVRDVATTMLPSAPVSPAVTGAAPLFDDVYREHSTYVWHSLRRLGVPERDRADSVQEVFVVVLRRLLHFDAQRPMKPWLFGIASRTAAAYRRRASTRHEHVDGDDVIGDIGAEGHAGEGLQARDAKRILTAALDRMDPDQRAIFILHDVDGVPVPACVEALDAPLATLYSRLRLAREKLARAAAAAHGTAQAQGGSQ